MHVCACVCCKQLPLCNARVSAYTHTHTVQCHLLNVDVVTQFDPNLTEMLNSSVESCEKCIASISAADSEAQTFVLKDDTTQTHS